MICNTKWTCGKRLNVFQQLIRSFSWILFTSVILQEGRHLCFLRTESIEMTMGFPDWTQSGRELQTIHCFLSGHFPVVQTGHSTSANQKGPWREALGCWGLFTGSWLCFSLLPGVVCVVCLGGLVEDPAGTGLDKENCRQSGQWQPWQRFSSWLATGKSSCFVTGITILYQLSALLLLTPQAS